MKERRVISVERRFMLQEESGGKRKPGTFRFSFESAAFLIAGLVLVAAALTLAFPQGPCQALRSESARTVLVTVQPGDTIWGIARRISGENADLRRVVHEIAELNNLDSGLIRPGQGILVPAQPEQVAGTTKGCLQ